MNGRGATGSIAGAGNGRVGKENRRARGRPDRSASSAAVALLFGTATTAAIVVLSAAPWTPRASGDALIRLSWRAAGALMEECREPTDAENERLPAHMRRDRICEGRSAPFLLRVSIDGNAVLHDTIVAAGARGDRPVYVLREIEVEPGPHDVNVEFDMLVADAVRDSLEDDTGFPPRVVLAARLELGPGEARLVTYDANVRRLVVRP